MRCLKLVELRGSPCGHRALTVPVALPAPTPPPHPRGWNRRVKPPTIKDRGPKTMEKVEVFLAFKAFSAGFSDVLGTSSLLNLPSRSLSIHHLARAGACRLSACGKKASNPRNGRNAAKEQGSWTQNDSKRLDTVQNDSKA